MGDERTSDRSTDQRAGGLKLDVPREPVRRMPASSMVVGAVGDAAERDADAVADMVLRGLGNDRPAAPAPPAAARVQRAVAPTASGPIGAAGGALDGDTAARIQRARGGGSALAEPVRRRMERGFAAAGRPADLGGVRLHQGSEASRLNEAMSAKAFTVGSDVFVHDSTNLAGRDGERVLAHELAHTTQNAGAVQRLWSIEQFQKNTSEGMLTAKSTAQKQIEKHLALYREAAGVIPVTSASNQRMIDLVIEMKAMANSWVSGHTFASKDGTSKDDPKRLARMKGMRDFVTQCDTELAVLARAKSAIDKTEVDASGLTVSEPSDGAKKVSDHYTGTDATSAFRRLGFLIDAAAPLEGDNAEVELTVKFPIAPGAYLGFEFAASVERDDGKVEVSVNLGVVGGGTAGAVEIGGALGGYLKATAKTGADAAELMSYGLFRRCRQSNLIPREVENLLWGGNSGGYGWQKAEAWSKGVETRILEAQDGSEVESGMYAAIQAGGKVGNVELEGEAKGMLGTRINKDSLTARKGGAGKNNLRSGKSMKEDTFDTRGAQKSVGVGTGGFELSFSATAGGLAGEITVESGWASDGAHGKKAVKWDKLTISPELSFEVPGNAKLQNHFYGQVLPNLVAFMVKCFRAGVTRSEAEAGAKATGIVAESVANTANGIAGLATMSKDAFTPLASADPEVGTEYGSSTKYSIGGEIDLSKKVSEGGPVEGSVTINVSKNTMVDKFIDVAGSADPLQMVEFKLSKTSRILKLSFDGKKWTPS
ncbi:MAG TPA: DUF4157 domain-containing protein [Ilumatobacter sp.]|nr:DUF4157 domain-containing protein [Ilumatobacter sp.]